MKTDLFRREAVENKCHSLWGSTLLVQPASFKFFTIILLAVVSSLVTYLIVSEYSRKETVRGYIVPDKGVVKVYPLSNGSFRKIWVKEGESIIKGQPLFRVDSGRRTNNGEVGKLMLAELDAQKKQIEQQIQLQKYQRDDREKRINSDISTLKIQLSKVEEQVGLQRQLLVLQHEKRDRHQALFDKKMISEVDMARLDEGCLLQKNKLQELESLQLGRQQELKRLQHDLRELPVVTSQRLSELQSSILSINRQILEADIQASQMVNAPVSGRITYLNAREGQFANGQMPALAILPEGAELAVELYVPTRSVGFVERGMSVKLRYDAYPYQRFGSHFGWVASYSKTVLSPREITAPINLEEPVYRVLVRLDSQSIEAYGKELPLQPGLALEADVILDKRSLFEWILEPLYSLKGRV
ncbi:HlyD family efflux transporter periplasmic adaptor subunit [Porticoccus sp. W117]|uniref:HlyD family secretion protein n=1 Tax=Porticoccus sp. W117 TaxID=3054777 RepID=UPI002591B97C|nr:HlyD family efflux transporter periplasmic adaptor subunit [Porticoccus sp. W117]MDM3871344.1 HlyD family efflux transporter periplasmic adaptor subunit [Porticoccus sp. W117]